MMQKSRLGAEKKRFAVLLSLVFILVSAGAAQDRLKKMPGYDQYRKVSKEMWGAVKLGRLDVKWAEDGKSFEYGRDGKKFRFDIASRNTTEIPKAADESEGKRAYAGYPERGRQFESALSPDKTLKAFHRDRNLWLSDADGKNEFAVTRDGNAASHIKYGIASWVYGEELFQTTAIWWSPDGKKIAFYRFDESRLKDFVLQMDQTKLYSTADIEAYPKAGDPNPVADIMIYDLASKTIVSVDVRNGRPFGDDVVGHYVYGVSWTKDGKELLFHRANRRQNITEIVACDPTSGKCRIVVREEWAPSWVENTPEMRFLEDGRRFVWASERTGFKNYYLYDLDGRLISTLTKNLFDAVRISHVDEKTGVFYYTAWSGDNPMKTQLHRVGLNGKGEKRLTDPAFHHSVQMSPDGKHFVDVFQTHDLPPATRLMTVAGKIVQELAASDVTGFEKLGLRKSEIFTFKAADGVTDLYGMLSFPSNFDPAKKYPVLVRVYAGPATNGARETFAFPSTIAELGFLVASFDSRSAGGRGKKFLDTIYGKLGIPEIDDQAAGVKALRERPYVDGKNVGIYGVSYGGYASTMCLLRHPDVFKAACACSPVTSWYHYDTIYTERYMGTPQENKAGYEAGNAMNYAKDLAGRLMLYYGTADNNVHPNNSMQLIQALQKAGKSFEVQVGPDLGHTRVDEERMMEFFIENLVFDAPYASR